MALDYLSDQTTSLSNLSLSNLSAGVFSALTTSVGALASGAITSTGAISGTSATYTGRVAVGGGKPIVFISASSVTLVATTCTATKSTTTTFVDNLVAAGDIITWGLGGSTSSLSDGLTLQMVASAASQIKVILSNCSVANAAQPAISLTYMIERMVW